MYYPATRWYMYPQPMKIGDYTLEFQHPFSVDRVYSSKGYIMMFWPQGSGLVGVPISKETADILEARSVQVDMSIDQVSPNRIRPEVTEVVTHERNAEGKPLQTSGGGESESLPQIEGSRARVGDAKYFLRSYASNPVDFDLPLIVDAEMARAQKQGIDTDDLDSLHDMYPALYWAKTYLDLRAYQAAKSITNIIPAATAASSERDRPEFKQWFVGSVDNFQPRQYYINLIDKKAKQVAEIPENLAVLFNGNQDILKAFTGIKELSDQYVRDTYVRKVIDIVENRCYNYGVLLGLKIAASQLCKADLEQNYADWLLRNPYYLETDRTGHLTFLTFLSMVIDGTIVDFGNYQTGGKIEAKFGTLLTNIEGAPNRVRQRNDTIQTIKYDLRPSDNAMDRASEGPARVDSAFRRSFASAPWNNQLVGESPNPDVVNSADAGAYTDAITWIMTATYLIGSSNDDAVRGNYQTGALPPIDPNNFDLDALWDRLFPDRKREAMLSTIASLRILDRRTVDGIIKNAVQFGIKKARELLEDYIKEYAPKVDPADTKHEDGLYLKMALLTYHLTPKTLAKVMLRSYDLSDFTRQSVNNTDYATGADFLTWLQSTSGAMMADLSGWSKSDRSNNVVTDAYMQLSKSTNSNIKGLPLDAPASAKTEIVADRIEKYFKQLAGTVINAQGLPNYSKADALVDHDSYDFLTGSDHHFVHTGRRSPDAGGQEGAYVTQKPHNEASGVHVPFLKLVDNKVLLANLAKICAAGFGKDVAPKMLPMSIISDLDKNSKHLGLKKPLPMRNVLLLDGDFMGIDTSVMSLPYGGQTVAIIVVNSKQLTELFGGYNTNAVLQALTHEIAHYYEKSYIKNSDRLRFERMLGHKQLYPTGKWAGHAAANKSEQFAILAEYMVWGSCARNIYYSNGAESVMEYFTNQYMTEEMLAYKR